MYWINDDIVFLKGAKNGAIYDLVKEKVYSVNEVGCEIIIRYINGWSYESDYDYLKQLKNNKLISTHFLPKKCVEYFNSEIKLEMSWIEITQTCNMKCLHCYEGEIHKSKKNVLELNEWKNVIDQLAAQKIKRLIVIGGEPDCHKNLLDILEYASKFDFKTVLFTNATLLSKELIKCIIENEIIVKVSVYGQCAEIHDRVTTVSGSFDKPVAAVNNLVKNGVYVEAAIIIMKENQDYLYQIVNFVKEIGMHYKKYDVIREVFGGKQSEHIPTNKELINCVSLTRPNFHITKKTFLNNQIRNTCWYGKISILENGDVVPCEFERSIVYGNICKNSLTEILKSSATKVCWFLDVSKIEKCKDCEYRFACKDCRPLGMAVCGNILTRNPRCHYNVYEGIWEVDSEL